jgi:3-deoxy-manno-octulosonate cytidylyltransferase (CMP-KDO synthetase)
MAEIKALGIIPARYDSSRFPGKPLADIAGKSMIQRVYEQSKKSNLLRVIVATDDERIQSEVQKFGGEVVLTDKSHTSGTDRCCEALQITGEDYDVVVNVQGDEPFIQPEQINTLIGCFDTSHTQLGTLVKPATSNSEIFDPNRVKVLLNKRHEAIYFSRAALPQLKDVPRDQWVQKFSFWIHIGLYAYRPHILEEITQLKPSALEKAESLEQLRWLENGYRIRVAETQLDSDPIDHPDDLRKMLGRIDAGDYIY